MVSCRSTRGTRAAKAVAVHDQAGLHHRYPASLDLASRELSHGRREALPQGGDQSAATS